MGAKTNQQCFCLCSPFLSFHPHSEGPELDCLKRKAESYHDLGTSHRLKREVEEMGVLTFRLTAEFTTKEID